MGLLDAPSKISADDYRRYTEGMLGLPVVGFSAVPRGQTTAGPTSATFKQKNVSRVNCRDVRLVYLNWYHPGTVETANPVSITVKASWKGPDNTIVQATFAGASTVTIPAGGQAISDPIGVDLLAGDVSYVLTYATVPTSSDKWPAVKYGNASDNEGQTNASDLTASDTVTAANGYQYGCSFVLGTRAADAPSVRLAAIGDSVMRGAVSGGGFGETYGLNSVGPFSTNIVHSAAVFGETGANFATASGKARRAFIIAGCNVALCGYGVNDVKTPSNTLAGVQGNLITIWRGLKRRGMTVWQWTITPNTTSTDAWVTVGNQTPATTPHNETNRTSLNDWIRDGAPLNSSTFAPMTTGTSSGSAVRAGAAGHPLSGWHEVADAVESARNSGKWKAGYTADGVHPVMTGYTAMSASINWAAMGLS